MDGQLVLVSLGRRCSATILGSAKAGQCLLQLTAVIPATLDAEIGRLRFEASLGKKLTRPHSTNKKSWVWWLMPVIPAT
jgi:hypothetical protein